MTDKIEATDKIETTTRPHYSGWQTIATGDPAAVTAWIEAQRERCANDGEMRARGASVRRIDARTAMLTAWGLD